MITIQPEDPWDSDETITIVSEDEEEEEPSSAARVKTSSFWHSKRLTNRDWCSHCLTLTQVLEFLSAATDLFSLVDEKKG